MEAMNRQRMMQSRFETTTGSEDECDGRPPPFKKRKLSPDPAALPHAETSYENTNTHGNARAHYGHVFNHYIAQTHRSSPPPPMLSPVFQDHQRSGSDAVRLIRALRFDHMDSRFGTIRLALEGTCEWPFAREEYKAWCNSSDASKHHGFLWIKGKPGTGKSTLMRSAYTRGVDTLAAGNVIASYFFGSHVTGLQSSAEGLYRSMLCQLLENQPQLSASLQKHVPYLELEHVVWHNELLKTLIRKAVLALDTKRLTCYVDAVDECGYSEAQDVIDFFKALREVAHKAGIEVRVLLSSRHYPQVDLNCCQKIILEDETEHQTDLSCYLERELRIGDSSQARKIRGIIQQRASGVFLWVVLIVQILNQDKLRGRVHQMEKRLQALPDGLHQLFENIVHSGPCDGNTLLLTLQWVLFANRPLLREELYSALINCNSQDEVQCWDPDEVSTVDMQNFILDSSKGLMEIVKGAQSIVQFIHGSVRDYLLDTGLSSLYPANTADPSALSHDRLKRCCQQHVLGVASMVLHLPTNGVRASMSQCFRKTNDFRAGILKSYPFLDYALSGMVFHSDKAESLGLRQKMFIQNFPLEGWVRLYNVLLKTPIDRLSPGVSREYIFVIKNALNLVESSFQGVPSSGTEDCIVAGEKSQSLLGAAVANSYIELAELLLGRGADPNSPVRNSHRCLNVAVMRGDSHMVRVLLSHGADVQRSAPEVQDLQLCPLRLAAESGLTEIVEMLLAHTDYATGWHLDMDHVLEAAIYRHDHATMRLLRDRMSPEMRDIVRVIRPTRNQSANGPAQRRIESVALQCFRVYYQNRDLYGPALLDIIHSLYKGYLHAPYHLLGRLPSCNQLLHREAVRPVYWLPTLTSNMFPPWLHVTTEAFHLSMSSHFAAMDTLDQVLALLDRSALTLPLSTQVTRRSMGFEDALGRFHNVDLAFVFDWTSFTDWISWTFLNQIGQEIVFSESYRLHYDDRGSDTMLVPRSFSFARLFRPGRHLTMSLVLRNTAANLVFEELWEHGPKLRRTVTLNLVYFLQSDIPTKVCSVCSACDGYVISTLPQLSQSIIRAHMRVVKRALCARRRSLRRTYPVLSTGYIEEGGCICGPRQFLRRTYPVLSTGCLEDEAAGDSTALLQILSLVQETTRTVNVAFDCGC